MQNGMPRWGIETKAVQVLMEIAENNPKAGKKIKRFLTKDMELFHMGNPHIDRLKVAEMILVFYRHIRQERTFEDATSPEESMVIMQWLDNHFRALFNAFKRGEFPKKKNN